MQPNPSADDDERAADSLDFADSASSSPVPIVTARSPEPSEPDPLSGWRRQRQHRRTAPPWLVPRAERA